MQKLTRVTTSEGEGFLLVYSLTSRPTFERVEKFKHQIARVKDRDRFPLVLVGNKADKANEREVSEKEGKALAERLGCRFVETSAKTRQGLEEAYYDLVRQIRAQRDPASSKRTGPSGQKKKKFKRCPIL